MALESSGDYDVYGIDLTNKENGKLLTVGWFYFSKTIQERIVGGNHRVLVEANSDQFWFDTENFRANDSDPTVYDKLNVSNITTLPVYSSGSLVYNFIGKFFQYVSLS